MQDTARAVVIGGGIIGCSVLYHLVRLGWRDTVLVEKGELTSGSTWHAAGQVPFFADSLLSSRIQKESFEFYADLEREAGRPVGQHRCGSLRLALLADQMREYERFAARARALGIEHELVGPQRAEALWPLLCADEVIGALHVPHDGYVDPSMTTNAIAAAARDGGATIHRHTRVSGLGRTAAGEWRVETDKGTIACEVVVNCAGFWAPELSAWLGHTLPVVAIEHEYLVTDHVPEVATLDVELPILRELGTPFYVRQERDGLLVSGYESKPVFWGLDGIPPGFGQELLVPDLDRAEPRLARTTEFVPALATAGIKTVVNGPTSRSPDLAPLLGPAHGLPGYWVFCGVVGGFLQSGAARYLARWIVDGEPGIDLSAFDVRRFGPQSDQAYAVACLGTGHTYSVPLSYPHTEPAAGRPAKVSPVHDRLAAKGACFGVRNGWEVPNWFAPAGSTPADEPSLGRANWFEPVGAECRAVRDRAGLADLSCLAKFEVTGRGAAAFLDGLCANRLPAPGAVAVAPLLTPRGRVAACLLLARPDGDRFFLTAAAAAEQRDEDWLRAHLPGRGVELRNVTAERGIFVLAGPRARAVLGALAEAALDDRAFPRFASRQIRVGGIAVTALRVGGTGELGWELHHDSADQVALYDALMAAGEAEGLADVGLRALDSLRLEKGLRRPGIDYGLAATPSEAGLDRFVRADKGDFLGRAAALAARADNDGRRPVCLTFDTGADAVDPWGQEAVLADGRDVGLVSSGGYGHRIGASVALACLPAATTGIEVEVMGKRYPARLWESCPYDPAGTRLGG